MPSPEPGLFAELRRRNVFRVAAMYAVAAWLVVQIADATFEPLGVPEAAHAKTLAPEGILVNTVSPGTFLTGGVRSWLEEIAEERGIDPSSLTDLNRIIEEDYGEPCDLGRAGLPEEIGAVIAFLASRSNSYMTGANVNVDGGSDFT